MNIFFFDSTHQLFCSVGWLIFLHDKIQVMHFWTECHRRRCIRTAYEEASDINLSHYVRA